MRSCLTTCAGFSVFSFITLVAFTIALRTRVMTLSLPENIQYKATSACLVAGILYGCCAIACVYLIQSDKKQARDLEFLAKAEESLEQSGSRMTKAGRRLAVRVHRDMTLGDPLLDKTSQVRISSLAKYLNKGSLGRT
eukprot:Blabericola_migrator_1__8801@NODE_4643_length_1045_cov_80_262781_g2889_i0_p1_GENE_NODE_4643_length_1045_cov_80_262781_g2889_i0NODE_4643_length_1045_cov_80_262781_g2889_i0_p1_ORF_typecomplete_len138_score16_26NPDC1/PF06809_11/0_02TMEM144/PF07857_12/0_036TPR_MalT/PF17874_1/0_083Use1/PF09753_9/0_19ABC2_membrane_3/PF12698_7/2_2_NODE_4643_length_1045_cov_80_262781_g2889_i0551964